MRRNVSVGADRKIIAAILMTSSALASVAGAPGAFAQTVVSSAMTADQSKSFSIPTGSLAKALTSFGAQSGKQVSVETSVIQGLSSPGIAGRMTAQQALTRLLAGTGLTYRLSGNVVTLVPASANITLGPVRVGGTLAHQDPTGPGVGYVAENTMSATKTNTSIMEIPNSIHVVTKQLIIDQQPQTIAQALRYVPGIYAESLGTGDVGAASDGSNSIKQRGFSTTQFVDGLMGTSGASGETAFVERIEAVNGPASVMYGQTTPGGMIGITLKKPTTTPLHEVSVGFGNWGRYEGTFDYSDKVNKSGTLRFRVAGIGVTQGTQTDHVKYQRVGILSSLTWDIDKDTSWTLLGMYKYTPNNGVDISRPVRGTLITDSEIPRISRSTFLGLPNFNSYSKTDAMLESQFHHRFNKFVNFDQTFRWDNAQSNTNYAFWDHAIDVQNISVDAEQSKLKNNTIQFDARLTGKFKIGHVQNKWVVGSDFRDYSYNSSSAFDASYDYPISMNVYNPRPNYTPCFDIVSGKCYGQKTIVPYSFFQEGIYFQDQIKWKGLSVLLGGRQDWVNYDHNTTTYTSDGNGNVTHTYKDNKPQPQSAFTWRAGLIYQFNFGLAPYFSYSTSFVPQLSTSYLGQPFAPLTGKQLEAGLKYKVPNQDILLTAAAFHIDEDHYLISDLVHGGSTDAGRVKSQGFEVSANANITKNLRLVASYSYTDTQFSKSNLTNKKYNPYTDSNYGDKISQQGMYVPRVPRNMFSVFADYTVPSTFMEGIGVNWGMRYIGSTYGDNVESYKVPSYILFDIGAHYDFGQKFRSLKGLKVQLSMSNLTNKYYVAGCQTDVCYLGEGRKVYGNISYSW
ncbi:Ferrichrysobactin receptor [Acetobacter pomorum DM001]|uniref:Ferrichrysobactin receptor n=1 Tax=Acetobacter pomorum DM001 TaxID=945681 RepID=F1YWG6_9PROT|nr:TonB-dependent siderophore receptor [Acetobacter pomorum]EGE46867.1 Ferrichrysobactin receptor [Acetobacter pomorum DM001]